MPLPANGEDSWEAIGQQVFLNHETRREDTAKSIKAGI
jgi:hypothetical protein